MQEWAEKRRDWLAALAVAALVVASLGGMKDVAAEEPFGLKVETQHGPPKLIYIRDFAAHLRFTREVWLGWDRGIGWPKAWEPSAYSPFAHWVVMSRWFGDGPEETQRQVGDWRRDPRIRALPFGYSPTMLYTLGPLTLLPDVWAYGVWTLLGWLAAWWMCRTVSPLTTLLILISPLTVRSQALGQTAILTTAGLLFLMLESRRESPRVIAMSLVLWALTAKPPLALTAGIVLLALRQWRPVAVAVGMTAVTTLLAWPWLGWNWVSDYLSMLFAWCLGPEYMSSLRSILSLYLRVPDDVSSRVALLLWLPALALVAWRGSWRSAVLAMLLLGPHVNATEDVALIVVAASSPLPVAALAIVAAWATPASSPPPGLLWPLPAFLLKVALLVAVLLSSRKPAPPESSS
jgi:hypothetical protein